MKLLNGWNKLTLAKRASFTAGCVGTAYLFIHCYLSNTPFLALLALLGMIAGYGLALVAAPFDENEERQFSSVAKAVSTFIGGYLVSTFTPLIQRMATPVDGQPAPIQMLPASEQLIVTLLGAGLSFFFVVGARLYWIPAKPKQKTAGGEAAGRRSRKAAKANVPA